MITYNRMLNKQKFRKLNLKKCYHRKWAYYKLSKSIKLKLNRMFSHERILHLKKNTKH